MSEDPNMTPAEIALARRIIGLRGTDHKARGNGWSPKRMRSADAPLVARLARIGHVAETSPGAWRMTGRGIEQLKLQIGEFTFRPH